MATLDDLKKRIASVKSTQKITKAMKMVAAAKLRRAQENAEKGRPYSEKMNNIILNLSSGISDKENAPKLLSGTGEEKVHLCIVLTSDRGLCGGFNTNIIKINNFSVSSSSFPELEIDCRISGFSDLHFSMIWDSKSAISLSSTSSKYPLTPQKTEITCSATVIGEYCFCFRSSVNFEPLFKSF